MGCASSKANADVAVADVYCPPPTSVSLFDINAVEEPWLIAKQNKAADDDDDDEEEETTDDDDEDHDDEKQPAAKTVVPLPLLDKLEGYELAPASWSEVSKALEDMKPVLDSKSPPAPAPSPKKKKTKKKKKKKTKTKQQQQQPMQPVVPAATDDGDAAAGGKKAPATSSVDDLPDSSRPAPPELAGRRVVKDNPFLTRDRESNKGAGGDGGPRWKRRDPFEGCPERRPPGAAGGGVVLYTTTLRGVRRTFEDCERAREAVEACAAAAGVEAVDERDVSLHGEYLRELRELLPGDGGAAPPPRLFVMGRYVGGAEECARLAESGTLREMMRWVKARGEACAAKDGRGCEGCGGARFVPCWECGGSCRVLLPPPDGGTPTTTTERCAKCNENGLMMCPICH
jgi:glutaredoxin domain-containing cysteine-rich protein 1